MSVNVRAMALLAALLASGAARAEEPKNPLIAVLEFRTKLDAQAKADADPTYFSDVVRSQALDELPGARIMTRENMTVLLAAAGKDLANCEGECDVDTGRNLGADEVINGELLKVGTSFKLDLKLHATRDGQLLAGAQASGKTVDELDAALPAAVTKLLAPLRTAAASPSAPSAPSVPVAERASSKPAPPGAPSVGATSSAPGSRLASAAPPPANPQTAAAAPGAAFRFIRVVDGRIVHRESFFDVGQRGLRREAVPMLREVAAALRGPPVHPALVLCRSDNATGAARRNALQRAWSLRHALVELGVSARELQARGADAAEQAQLVRQVANPYPCEILLR